MSETDRIPIEAAYRACQALFDRAEGEPSLWPRVAAELHAALARSDARRVHEDWLIARALLAFAYLRLREFGREARTVDEMVGLFEALLDETQQLRDVAKWLSLLHAIGNLYLIEFERTRDTAMADKAIRAYSRVLRARHPVAREVRLAAHFSLASVYAALADLPAPGWTREAHAFGRARRGYGRAMALARRERDKAMQAAVNHALAALYSARCRDHLRRGERAAALRDAARARTSFAAALRHRAGADARQERANTHHSLGILNRQVYEATGDERAAASAAAHYRRALSAWPRAELPVRWAEALVGLGNLAYLRAERAKAPAGRRRWLRAAERSYAAVVGVDDQRLPPSRVLTAARRSMFVRFELGDPLGCVAAYGAVERAIEDLSRAQPFRRGRAAWLTEVRGLPQLAAWTLARLGLVDQAAEVLERGLARLLGEALRRDRADLSTLTRARPDLAARHRRLTERLWTLDTGRPSGQPDGVLSADEARSLRAQLAALEEEARAVHGCDRLFASSRIEDMRAAAREAPLVYFCFGILDGLALVVYPDETVAVRLPQLRSDLLSRRLGHPDAPERGTYLGAYGSWRANPGSAAATASWRRALGSTLDWLWDAVMGPVVAELERRSVAAAVLVPTSHLALLPLHAARRRGASGGWRYALDDLLLRYAPSATALIGAPARMDASTDRLLLVRGGDPPGAPPLRHVLREVRAVAAAWRRSAGADRVLTHLAGTAASPDRVRAELPDHGVFHFAGHAEFDIADPDQAGLRLASGQRLGLADWYAQRVHLRLAVLAGCETSVQGIRNPEEAESLPSALLEAGTAGVVGTLWAVPDDACAGIVGRLYRTWMADPQLGPAECLRRAQQWLRDRGGFQDPFYWAPFTYMGA